MAHIEIGLTSKSSMAHVPLAVFGYALRHAEVLQPLQQLDLPIKAITHTASEKIMEALVLILAGGRATSQVELLLRPNRLLARAWGQDEFAQQSTLADTLDAMTPESVNQLRTAFETMVRDWSACSRHDFRRGGLMVDDDLTGLPAARQAEGSTKGYFAGEKTQPGGKSRAWRSVRIAKLWVRCSTPAGPRVCRRFSPVWPWPKACCA